MATCSKKSYASTVESKNATSFSAADFQKWNQTTAVINLPSKLVAKHNIPQLRGELINSIGAQKVAAVQALSKTQFRIEYSFSSYRREADANGINFRGLTITPYPAYEQVKSVFVERAPLQMPDQTLREILAPYGRVLAVEHLKVRGFPTVKSGTRRVSMVITNHIPAILRVAGFQISFRYHGQPSTCFVCDEVGHAIVDCPKSRKNKKRTEPNNTAQDTVIRGKGEASASHLAENDLRN